MAGRALQVAAKKDAAKIIAAKETGKETGRGKATTIAKSRAPNPAVADTGDRTSSIKKPDGTAKSQAAL